MSKPNVKDVLNLLAMKEEAAALYEAMDAMVSSLYGEFGAGRFDFDLEKFIDEHSTDHDFDYDDGIMQNGRYLKLEIVDNLAKMQAGENVWKNVNFKAVSFSARSLKRCPESLK